MGRNQPRVTDGVTDASLSDRHSHNSSRLKSSRIETYTLVCHHARRPSPSVTAFWLSLHNAPAAWHTSLTCSRSAGALGSRPHDLLPQACDRLPGALRCWSRPVAAGPCPGGGQEVLPLGRAHAPGAPRERPQVRAGGGRRAGADASVCREKPPQNGLPGAQSATPERKGPPDPVPAPRLSALAGAFSTHRDLAPPLNRTVHTERDTAPRLPLSHTYPPDTANAPLRPSCAP